MTDTEIVDWLVSVSESCRQRINSQIPCDQEIASMKVNGARMDLLNYTLGTFVLTLRRKEPITRDTFSTNIERHIVQVVTDKLQS